MSTLRAERAIDCPFSLALERADTLLRSLESTGARIPLRSLGLPVGGALTHRVGFDSYRRRDAAEPGRSHDEIAFEWTPRYRSLPNLQGTLRFRMEHLQTRIALQGTYVPPFGVLGGLFDRILGRRLASATAEDLLDRLQAGLESAYRELKARDDVVR